MSDATRPIIDDEDSGGPADAMRVETTDSDGNGQQTFLPASPSPTGKPSGDGTGLRFDRIFSKEGVHPFDEITWERRTAAIKDDKGKVVFEQKDVEVPVFWSALATNIVFDKYAYGRLGTAERESSVRQIVGRVVEAIVAFGDRRGYFATPKDRDIFADEQTWLLVNQCGAYNSPVWFNVGCRPGTGYAWDFEKGDVAQCSSINEPRYQTSACFIVGAKDTIGVVDSPDAVNSISRNLAVEMNIFKFGSGVGADRSRLRSCREPVRGGGRASGPVPFMRAYDAIAGVTKSGGITRRAARMDILRVDHPDILEFVTVKPREEDKAKVLVAAGYEANYNGEAYSTVAFQNVNLTVRVTDDFMRAVEADVDWQTLSVVTGKPEADDGTTMPRYKAGWLMDEIARASWRCGDPNLQYDAEFQRWNTIPAAGPVRATNPCSEYCSCDDSACNLASLNLMKFRRDDGSFDVERYRAAVRAFVVAQDILVDLGSYPTPEIARNAHRYRQLGPGYANLGALIMATGKPYDSDEGRALAAAVTSILTGQAFLTSAEVAERLGPFDGFAANRDPMLRIMGMHHAAAIEARKAAHVIFDMTDDVYGLRLEADRLWERTIVEGRKHGYRNSECSCLAPTGTIGLMMDCDTLGVEPELALVRYKNLWGRGQLKLVNRTVPMALKALGYDDIRVWNDPGDEPTATSEILQWIEDHDTIEGCPLLKPEHLPVFDCAFPPANGTEKRSIHWRGHVKMMSAVQPHISMAISKTVNMPRDATVADIRAAYLEGWKLGLKALAIYRDGSKESQPVSTTSTSSAGSAEEKGDKGDNGDDRRRDPAGPAPESVDAQRSVSVGGSVGDDLLVLPPARGQLHPQDGQVQAPRRERLPDTRTGTTHKLTVGQVEAYLTANTYPDGRLGEIFVEIAKQGSTVGGLMDAWATMVSIALQYGVPPEVIARKFSHGSFPPAGITRNPDIPFASSLIDYIARWIGMQYVPGYREEHAPRREGAPPPTGKPNGGGGGDLPPSGRLTADLVSAPGLPHASGQAPRTITAPITAYAPVCLNCGGLCIPNGAHCWVCSVCATTTGGCG